MTQRASAQPVGPTSPRVPCPLRGGVAIDLERCLTCAYFRGNTVCGTDQRELAYAGPNWWRLLVP
jgi:hypothetical protein